MGTYASFYGMEESWFEAKGAAYTSLEIARQGELWRKLLGILGEKKDEISSFMGRMGDLRNLRVILTGAGSSAYVGEVAALINGKTAKIRCEPIATTDIVSSPRSVLFADIPTLMVSFARSGNSPESVCALQYARSIVKDLWELAIVCDGDSALAKLSGESSKSMVLAMPGESNDKGFAMTSSVTCMNLACYAFFNIDKLADIGRDIGFIAGFIEKEGLKFTEIARSWAEKDYERLIIIGSGCCKGLAREAALKSMELSAGEVNTNYESSMGFRHGPKAVIKDNTLTVHFISPDPLCAKYDIDLLKEIGNQRKGNKIITLSTAPLPVEADESIIIPKAGGNADSEFFFGICALVFCQLLAMFKSMQLGLTADNPVPGGEITRVVSGVTLYPLE